MTACRDCGATLRFVRMESGKAMPCNAVADPSGNVAARLTPKGCVDGYVITAARPLATGWTAYRPHFADCDMRPAKPLQPPVPKPRPDSLL